MNKENIIKAIENLLAKANDEAATEAEAMQAARMAQKLMKKYHVESLDLGKAKEDIVENYVIIKNREWVYALMNVVARNFCCKSMLRHKLNRETLKFEQIAVFYGRIIIVLSIIK